MMDRIIISMTSYPARIKYVGLVWFSIIKQIKPEYNIRCVLVLSEEEFPQKFNALPADIRQLALNGFIEILWTPRNTRSHKKLMPVLEKYPDDSILIIDDDQIRPDGWLDIFVKDHARWPHDVLAGRIEQREVRGHFVWRHISDDERGTVIKYGRSQNGRGGTLYPAHTFKLPDFFNEAYYMKYSASSDESWQYFWLKKQGIFPRATTRYIRDEAGVIWGAQKTALWNENADKYDNILAVLNKTFPG